MNQAQPTPRARRGDPGGHGGFTYMVMYSVRAQSSRYIGLSQSSDTMPHCTTKCSFPPSAAVSLGSHLFLLPLLLPLSSRRDIVIHYSILRYHEFPGDVILIVCCAAARQHTVGLRRETRGGRRSEWRGAENRPGQGGRRGSRGDASTIQCTTFEHYLNA